MLKYSVWALLSTRIINQILDVFMDIISKVKTIRKELHNNPERSGCEEKTKSIIKEFLRDNTELCVSDYNKGIVAIYEPSTVKTNTEVKTIAFRADFDAVSMPDGTAAHICGHDGHTAALLGAALEIEKLKPDCKILFIFQPAEETGEGAKAMADILDEYDIQEIYGCHNLPGYDFGKVYTSLDTFACASCGITFNIKGKPSHAAYPEKGVSPIRAVMELFKAIEDSNTGNEFEKGTFATLVGCSMGQKAFGTSAENAEVWITVRSRTDTDFIRIKEYLEHVVKEACRYDGIDYSLSIQDEFTATVNNVKCAEKVIERCNGILLKEPMRWSEDFGYFLNHGGITSGAFFGIGAGECSELHTKDYEYPDDLLEHQINAFIKLI